MDAVPVPNDAERIGSIDDAIAVGVDVFEIDAIWRLFRPIIHFSGNPVVTIRETACRIGATGSPSFAEGKTNIEEVAVVNKAAGVGVA